MSTAPPNSATCSASHGPPCTAPSDARPPGNARNDQSDHSLTAVLGMVPCLAVSALLTLHLPGAAISRVITIFTLSTLSAMVIDAAARLNSGPSGQPHPAITGPVAVLSSVLWVGTWPLIAVLLVVFPDGVPPTGWWRRAFIGQMIAVAVAVPVLADQADGSQVVVLTVLGSVAGVFLLVTGAARAVWLVGGGIVP